MEDVLTQIVITSNNFPDIQKAAQEAVDLLAIQEGLIRDPAYQLREKCLLPFQLCLETKRRKFATLAVSGFHKIIRDDRFYSNFEPDDDTKWLPLQLLQATKCFLTLSDDTQVEIFKIFLHLACSKKWAMNGRIIISIISLCYEAFECGNTAIRAAAQAGASQTLRTFCIILEEEIEEKVDNASNFNEIIPVLQFFCSKIDETTSSKQNENGMVFLLECILTVFSSLPQYISSNAHFRIFLWQKFCPILISVIGTPKYDKHIITRISFVEKERGRGSGGIGSAPNLNTFQAKTVYSIINELVRLIGSEYSLRPVLESIFHRVLLYPLPEHRLDALKATAELIRNPNRLLDITGPVIQKKEKFFLSDMSLLRLIMDSVEESSKTEFSILQGAVQCCFNLLKAVEELSLGKCIPSSISEIIYEMYPTLVDSDYTGPRTYESRTRLPQLYREQIQKAKEQLYLIRGDQSCFEKQDCESFSSGDTEGPEEIEDIDRESANLVLEERITPILNVIPRDFPLTFGDCDRQRARHFIGGIRELLPLLMPMRSCIQIDQALQGFASQYCEGIFTEQLTAELSGINAEGIYLAVYSALLLDKQLFEGCYYSSPEKKPLITEEDFIIKMQGIDLVAYLSVSWLRELYQVIVSSSLLQDFGYLPTNLNSQPHALINLLTDVEGLSSYQQGSQMLWDCRRLEKKSSSNEDNAEGESGSRISRRILTCCCDSIMNVLAIPFSHKYQKFKSKKFRDLKFLGNEDNQQKQMRQVISTSIEGLQILTKLCNNLGLQNRCGIILQLLASASCNDFGKTRKRFIGFQNTYSSDIRLTPSHSLTLDLLLSSGLELGSHCSECWPQIFRCCSYVKKLEHKFFSNSENRAFGSTTKVTRKEKSGNVTENEILTFDPHLVEDTCVDVYSFLYSSELPQSVSEFIVKANLNSNDVLKISDAAKIICVLSQLVDKLFDDAALKLNLKSFEIFSKALCESSQQQLFPPTNKSSSPKYYWWTRFGNLTEPSADTLLLDSIGEIMLKCIRSGRPLFHSIRIWAIIGPHLVEAACHKDLLISRRAIKQIHDIINTMLTEHLELPYFHINESLFKPFESLLCLEICELDIQDQIVSCICEFVEANFTEIRSGWRPLFGALRAVSTNLNSLLDIFRIFLETDNALVFSNAAVDYIKCLLKHLRAESNFSNNPQIGFEILKYLKKCENILSSMYKMPQCICTFQSAHHIQVSDELLVDPIIENCNNDNINHKSPEDLKTESEISYYFLLSLSTNNTYALEEIDRSSGVLKVWFLLLEGIHSVAISANSAFQPLLLDMQYNDLGKLLDNSDPLFGLFIFNRLVLPITQSWLRQLSKAQESDFFGLKQSIGLLSDSVLLYFNRLYSDKTYKNSLTLLLKQVLLLLSECCVHPVGAIAKIGPACIRHIILNIGKIFTSDQWKLVTLTLHRTSYMTLNFLKNLMVPFSLDSHYYYGDLGQVKVAARRALNAQEIQYTMQLSNQVFLLDFQRQNLNVFFEDKPENQKIYTFLIHNSNDNIVKIPLKILVIALHAHQSILQIIADTLLQGTKHFISSLANILNRNGSLNTYDCCKSETQQLPGLMNYLKTEDLVTILDFLDYSYQCSLAFDFRPGLKFLIQKVCGLEQAANLYRQTGAAWTIKLVFLFEYCLISIKQNNLEKEDVRKIIENLNSENNDFHLFLNRLRKSFNDLCDIYIDKILNNDNINCSKREESGRPLFFLITSTDDQFPKVETIENGDSKNTLNIGRKNFEEKEIEIPKKFSFLSDFSHQSNYKSEKFQIDISLEKTTTKKKNNVEINEKSEEVPLIEQVKLEEVEEKKLEYVNFVKDALNDYKKKNFLPSECKIKNSTEPLVPPEIEQQRRNSFLKDSEALHRVWTEMLGSVFELLQQLDDTDFEKLLPIFIDGIRRLMAQVYNSVLKQAVSDIFHRIAVIYGFGVI